MNRSQFGQDLHVANEIYKGKKNGFFVEIGAYDGIISSNTLFLEKERNWKGICIECDPDVIPKLKKNRGNCVCVTDAIYNEDGLELEFIKANGLSGLTITNSHKHILNNPKYMVKTKKLITVLDELNAPKFIEFISLDTEGSEFEILNSFDFEKYKIGYFCIEHNFIEKNRVKIRTLLESKGYRFYRQNNVDDDYILNDIEKYL